MPELTDEAIANLMGELDAHAVQDRPLFGHGSLTVRDNANAIASLVLRGGHLAELRHGEQLVYDPRFARLTDTDMKIIEVEVSARLAHQLHIRDSIPHDAYQHLISILAGMNGEAERHAITMAEPAKDPSHLPVCASCDAAVHGSWSFCPHCGQKVSSSK